MEESSYIYILSNKYHTTLYVGVTSNLAQRIYEHKNGIKSAFAHKYNLDKLVYYEIFSDITLAIQREKQLKAGSRAKKVKLIQQFNPGWLDLSYKCR